REQGGQIMVRVDGRNVDPAAGPRAGSGRAAPGAGATPGVENSGTITANHGTITLGAGDAYSLALRNSGTIAAPGGSVTLSAADGTVRNSGTLSASVGRGRAGSVTVQGPVVEHSGTAAADADAGKAGSVEITSSRGTLIADGSTISAAGGS